MSIKTSVLAIEEGGFELDFGQSGLSEDQVLKRPYCHDLDYPCHRHQFGPGQLQSL